MSDEAQLDQRTAEICLGEVVAAKGYPPPNLLILVGDRRGWVPLRLAIPQAEFEAVAAWLAERGRADAVRELHAVYRLDENYLMRSDPAGLTPAYTLLSREDEIPHLAPAAAWQRLEDRLRSALQEAAEHLFRHGRMGRGERNKYVRSLTDQEIVYGIEGHQGLVVRPEAWDDDANKLDEQVRTLLAAIERPAVVFVDALDQLKKPHRMGWLPDALPPALRIVVSVLDDTAYGEDSGACHALRQRLPTEAFLAIEPLSGAQGRDILLALESTAAR